MIKLNLKTTWVIFGLGCEGFYFCFLVGAFFLLLVSTLARTQSLEAFNFGPTKNIVMYLMVFLSCEHQAMIKSNEVWEPQ